jgi:dienelactone hydrolase
MLSTALLVLSLGAAAAPAPIPAALKPLPGEAVDLRAVDGWALKAVWQVAQQGKPTVLLLHGTGQRKEDWRLFARSLARAGLGYMAVDLRGHGESRLSPTGETISYKKLRATKAVNDYADMTRDAEAAVAYLAGQGVPEETIGVVGAEVGGSIGVKYAAVHSKAPFVVLLSPGLAWQEIPLVNAVRAFKGRNTPILMVHSEKDKRSSKETPLLYAFSKNAVGTKNTTLFVVPEERGTRLIKANKGLADRILAWIANPVSFEPPAASSGAASSVSTDTSAAPGEDPAESGVSD